MCSPRPTLIYLHNHTMSKTASSDAYFMDYKTQRWNDLYRVIKLVNDTLEDVSPTSSSLPGERWRILEHSQVLISHPKGFPPKKSSGRICQLGELEQWLEHPAPGTRGHWGPGSMQVSLPGEGSQSRDWDFTSWCFLFGPLFDFLVTLKDKREREAEPPSSFHV